MTLSQEKLSIALNGRDFRYFDSVDSTNILAREWLLDGAKTGSVVIADEQKKGRGRKGRFWHTPPGVALAVSVILHPDVRQVQQISMLGALAVYDLVLAQKHVPIGIKWANDVQVDGRKISGILPEAVWERQQLRGVVLGMGVNVRVDFAGTELDNTAINLETIVGQSLDRAALIQTLLERIDYWYAQLGTDMLFQTWKGRLNTIGQQVTIDDVSGVAIDVDADGALLVKTETGHVERALAGDVMLNS